MRRGTRVGQAYVAVTADGSGINDEIADAFEDVDYKGISKKMGRQYREALAEQIKGFDKEFDDLVEKRGNRLASKLSRAIETDRSLDGAVSKKIAQAFDNGRLDDLILRAGEKSGVEFSDGFERETKAVLDSLERTLDKAARDPNFNLSRILTSPSGSKGDLPILGAIIDDAVAEIRRGAAEELKIREKASAARLAQERLGDRISLAMREEYEKDLARLFDERDLHIQQSEEANVSLAAKFAAARLKLAQKSNEDILKSDQDLAKKQQKIWDKAAAEFEKRTAKETKAILAEGEKRLRASEKLLNAETRLRIQNLAAERKELEQLATIRFDRVNESLSAFEDRIGRLTGQGSRNNFLNFIGSLTQNITRLAGVLPRVGAQLADTFAGAFNARGGGFAGVVAGLTASAAQAIKGITANIPVLIGTLAALVLAIGPVVAAISLLAGTVTALAGSLTFALTGALAAAAAAVVPLTAGIGVAVLAFQGLDKAQKKALSNDFRPMVKQAKELRSATAGSFFEAFNSEGVSGNLTKGLKTLQPLLASISRAVADVAERFSRIATSSAFTQFVNVMQGVLPRAVRNLGDGLAGFTEGFLGVLRALAPTIESVSEYLGDIGERFSEWANSAAGQRSLTQFFADSAKSLSDVKGFLGEVIGLVSDLFTRGGREAGDGLFDSMTGAIEGFRKSIRDGEIQRWFADTEKFARTLGDAIVGIMRVFDALDNEFTRSAASVWIKSLELGAKTVEVAIDSLGQVILGIGRIMLVQADAILLAFQKVSEGISGVLAGMIDSVAGVVEKLASIPGLGAQFKPMAVALRAAADGARTFSGATEKLESARATIDKLKNSLSDVAKGVSPQDLGKLETLREHITNIPDNKITKIVAEGTELSAKKIRDLTRKYNLTPGEINTLVKLLGDEPAKEKLAGLLGQANEFGASRPSPLISVRDQATGVLNTVLYKRNQLRDRQFTITAVYKTRREGGTTPGFGPQGPAPQAAGRVAAPMESGLSASAVEPLMRQVAARVAAGAETATGAAADAEAKATKKAKTAFDRLDAALRGLRKKAKASLAKATKGEGASDSRDRVKSLIERLRDTYIGKKGKNKEVVREIAATLREQNETTKKFIKALARGKRVEEATLADYAAARERVAKKLERAKDRLQDALDIRNDFAASVAASVRAFGAITTAEGSVLDGVRQDVTATDITKNLQDRLDQIRTFQENLRILVAQGLSNEAYQQLVEEGVEGGGAYVQALVDGSAGTVGQVNDLVSQIGSIADALGVETSTRLYQAGVDAAKGLVDGLESMSERIDNAAARLGASIANAVKKALGIDDDDTKGKGKGGKGKGGKNSNRSASARVATSPQAAAAKSVAQGSVSGNDAPTVGSLTIVTPTSDPVAVAKETMNEMVGRLP